jgi:hypothetical protein
MVHVEYKVMASVFRSVAILWDITVCSPYVKQRFGESYHFHLQDRAYSHLSQAGVFFSLFSAFIDARFANS